MKKILFIINPKAGAKKKIDVAGLISKYLDKEEFEVGAVYTEHAGHATQLAADAVSNGFDIVVSCGGDGTLNETARALIGTNTALSILPLGSGNGLARHLGIPMNICKAIQKLNSGKVGQIDYIKINDHYSFNISGVGFDAQVAHAFAKMTGRGLKNYVKATLKEYSSSNNIEMALDIDGKEHSKEVWMLSICNSSQFGNQAFIAPNASVSDGLMDICIMKKISIWKMPIDAWRIFTKKITSSPRYENFQCKNIILKFPENTKMHIDGEPIELGNTLDISVAGKIFIFS